MKRPNASQVFPAAYWELFLRGWWYGSRGAYSFD